MKKIALPALLVLALVRGMPSATLYDQSIAAVLREHFTSQSVSYLLINTATGSIVASHWENLSRPVAAGSLVKPFTALAYGQSHSYQYPEFTCRGTADGCWLPRGHGRIGMSEAIAYSCNAYFRQLAGQVRSEDAAQVLWRYGVIDRFALLRAPALVGLDPELRIQPERLTRAYIELVNHSGELGVPELLQGMALSAQVGTANAIQRSLADVSALAKTGTAPCVHTPRAPGDGFVIMLYPGDSPRLALLVRVHGVPGSHAAVVGGKMLRTIVTGK
jgi:cell division protein FtsI/penicillin-binding protein 2